MLKFVIDCLRQQNYRVTLAYYQPYSVTPNLSVPAHKLFARKPAVVYDRFYDTECVGVGCWLPELEVSHYWNSRRWKNLISDHDLHISVSGSCMAALCLLQSKVPFMAWVASDWHGDREHRVRTFPLFRQVLDRIVIAPVSKIFEKKIIRTGNVVALSENTQISLNNIAQQTAVRTVLAMPVDTEHFSPIPKLKGTTTLGFVGRFEDPRKHISLLFDVTAELANSIANIKLILIGDQLSDASKRKIDELGIIDRVSVMPYVDRFELPKYLRQLDIFVLPSYQEGLCIAALEAMSCGIPVVSTRCGGPESYIIDGENGRLCDHDSASISSAISQLLADSSNRKHYAKRARDTIINNFSIATQATRFRQILNQHIADRISADPVSQRSV